MKGRIIKGIAGFYYVHTGEETVYTCKAKGIFRKDGIKPLVGDYVEIDILEGEDMTANISQVLERNNSLIRPNVANIDQALIIFALKNPEPNFVTLDKMILQYRMQDIPVMLCFNKEDLVGEDFLKKIIADYSDSGCSIYITSASNGTGIEELKQAIAGKTTAVAGPSGAGKSSIVNSLCNMKLMETGDISHKLARGKHTTRHSEIIPVDSMTYIMDTPGFSSFELYGLQADELSDYYAEFAELVGCRFAPCSHTHEPGCVVKENVDAGIISKSRYDNYVYIYEELSKSRRY